MSPLNLQFSSSLLIFLLVSLFVDSYAQFIPGFPCPPIHPHDTKVLLLIKNRLGNPSTLDTWDPDHACCGPWLNWNGIECDGQGHITTLEMGLPDEYKGPIPPYLDRLPALTNLRFRNVPGMIGPIPNYIGKLTNLTSFVIISSNVTGPIPNLIGRLTNLSRLCLAYSRFTGPIPNFIGRLTKLNDLSLDNNFLSGSIPSTLAKLTNLNVLDLDSNNLSGRAPDFLGRMNINAIHLESNQFSGPIPKTMGLFRGLTALLMSNNQLNGSIPKSLGQSTAAIIRLSNNKLTGDASFLFDNNNTAIMELKIDNNLLKFDFSNVGFGPYLTAFDISHNMIYGSLPKNFYKLKDHFGSIDVSYNELCGPIYNGRRLKQVDPNIFAHNKCLCGGPLPACK